MLRGVRDQQQLRPASLLGDESKREHRSKLHGQSMECHATRIRESVLPDRPRAPVLRTSELNLRFAETRKLDSRPTFREWQTAPPAALPPAHLSSFVRFCHKLQKSLGAPN